MGRKGKKGPDQGAGAQQPGPSRDDRQGPPQGAPQGQYQQQGPPPGGYQQRGPPPGGYQQRRPPPGDYQRQQGAPQGQYQQQGPPPGGYQQRGPPPGGYQQQGPPPGGYQQRRPPPGGYQPRGPSPGGFQQRGPSPGRYQQPGGLESPGVSGPGRETSHGSSPSTGSQHGEQSQSLGQGQATAPAWGPGAVSSVPIPPVSAAEKKSQGAVSSVPIPPAEEKERQVPAKRKGKGPAQEASKAKPETSKETTPETEGSSRKKGKAVKSGGVKPAEPSPGASASKPSASGDSSIGKALTKELVKAAPKYLIPVRKEKKIKHSPKVVDRTIRLEVNYIPILIKDWNMQIFHYDVTFNPDKPKGLYRQALNMMQLTHYPKRHPAFDGKKNLYAGRKLLDFGDTVRDSVKIFDQETQREKEFDITIKLAPHSHELRFSDLQRYMKGGDSTEIPQDVIQASDIALRSGLYSRFIQVGRSFFSQPANVDLGGGLELWDGFYQSKIVAWQPYLNVDVANKAFPIDQDVIDYMKKNMRNWSDTELINGLSLEHQNELHRFLKGLKILYMGNDQAAKRTYRVNGLGMRPMEYKFELSDGKKTDVYSYFKDVKKINIKYPKLPLLHVGPPQKNTMVPIEFCRIIGSQVVMRKLNEIQTSNMVRAAATATDIRKKRIMDNIYRANYNADKTLSDEFGISVGGNFTQVESVVFKPPAIRYKNNEACVKNGVWRMENSNQFIRSPQNGLENWAVLVKDERTYDNDVRNMIELFKQCGKQMGLFVNEPQMLKDTNRQSQNEARIIDNLKQLNRSNNLQIVVVIMGGRGETYNYIKRASELKTGVLTQCLKPVTVSGRKMNPMTATNILLKINAKINGVNHSITGPLKPAVFNEPIMFVGADVTHPSPGAEGTVSIAAVAASFDPTGFRYKMMYHLQPPKMEMIRDLEETMIAHLTHFKKCNKVLPRRILYYRDGVSEGQFSQVLGIELTSLKNACLKIEANYQPKVTFLVVQKRHHTRFFPRKQDGDGSRNNNVLAGTVVDSEITHPTELDFYLVSHQSIQGTARPTKYHVLWDENEFKGEEMELLTYYLCYMFSRCNRSVSYPAPTYYAHLGAERARAYWDGQRMNMGDLKSQQRVEGTIHPDITDMFFV